MVLTIEFKRFTFNKYVHLVNIYSSNLRIKIEKISIIDKNISILGFSLKNLAMNI